MRFYILLLLICLNVFASEDCYESLHGFTGQKLSDSQVELVVKFLAQNGHYLKAKNNSEELTKLLKSEFDLEVSMITLYRRAKAQNALIKDPNPVTNRNKIKITKERVELLLSKIEEQGISFGKKSFEVENKSKIESLYKELTGESVAGKSLYNWINKNLSLPSTSRKANEEIKRILSDEVIKGMTIFENRYSLINLFFKYKGFQPSKTQIQDYAYRHFYEVRHYFSFYRVTHNFQFKLPSIKKSLETNKYLHLTPSEAKDLLREELLKIYGNHISEIRMLQWIELMELEPLDFNISEKSIRNYEWFKTVQKGIVYKDERIKKIRNEEGFEVVHEDDAASPEDIVIGLEEITADYIIDEMNIKDERAIAYLRATFDQHIFDPYEIARFHGIPVQDVVFGMNWLASNPEVKEALIEMLGG